MQVKRPAYSTSLLVNADTGGRREQPHMKQPEVIRVAGCITFILRPLHRHRKTSVHPASFLSHLITVYVNTGEAIKTNNRSQHCGVLGQHWQDCPATIKCCTTVNAIMGSFNLV